MQWHRDVTEDDWVLSVGDDEAEMEAIQGRFFLAPLGKNPAFGPAERKGGVGPTERKPRIWPPI